jgi:hypothetical protein
MALSMASVMGMSRAVICKGSFIKHLLERGFPRKQRGLGLLRPDRTKSMY